MNYISAINYLFSFLNFEAIPFQYRRDFNIKRMAHLIRWFGDPQHTFPSVLVAGTKGKGSTANFLASILAANQYSTGLYTSPHLSDPRERIRINGRAIAKNDFARVLTEIRRIVARRKREIASYGPITFFEILSLLAILYFAKRKVDLAIFEVGMGGRLDATNVLNPLVSVITPISFDHEEHLGHTLKSIAREKAAIIKKRGYVISALQPREALQVIQERIKKEGARGFLQGSSFHTRREMISLSGGSFDFQMGSGIWTRFQIRLLSGFQIQNAAVALAAAGILENQFGFNLKEAHVRQGLRTAFWPGRFEMVKRNQQTFILDGAHNGASMNELCLSLNHLFPRKKKIVILGTSREKDLKAILKPLLPIAFHFIATKSRNPRAQEPKVILETVHKMEYKKPTFWAPNLQEALRLAVGLGMRGSVIVITGSLFLVGEARTILKCRKLI